MLALNTRYLTIQLDIDGQNVGGAAGTATTKYIIANSGVRENNNKYLSCDITIQRSVGFVYDTATVIIKGISESDINTFTKTNLGNNLQILSGNKLTIYAGYTLDSNGIPPLVFQGFTLRSAPDYNISRDRPFIITAMVQYNVQQTIAPHINIQGTTTVDNLFKAIATNGGFDYMGNNVSGNAVNPIYTGDLNTQLYEATKHYGYYYKPLTLNSTNTTIAVAKIGQPLIDETFTLSADNGMIGFPLVEDYGFAASCYFNPSLKIGQKILVSSVTLDYINNQPLYINAMTHKLQNKDSHWNTKLQLNTYPIIASNTIAGTPA